MSSGLVSEGNMSVRSIIWQLNPTLGMRSSYELWKANQESSGWDLVTERLVYKHEGLGEGERVTEILVCQIGQADQKGGCRVIRRWGLTMAA